MDWAWDVVGHALGDLGVDASTVEQRGNVLRFAVVEGHPSFIEVAPAPNRLDELGHVQLKITTLAGEGLEFDDVADALLELNRATALGRWVWYADGAVGRVSTVVGTPETLAFLPAVLPHLLALSAIESVRARSFNDRWSITDPPAGALWSRDEAVQLLYDVVGHEPVPLPLDAVAAHEAEQAGDRGGVAWYSAGGDFRIAETPFLEAPPHPIDPDLHPSALVRFTPSIHDPVLGNGSRVTIELPEPAPSDYGWGAIQPLNVLSADQGLLGLGAWTVDVGTDDRYFPRFASFVPAAIVATISDMDRATLSRALVLDAAGQVRFAARLYESIRRTPRGEHLGTELTALFAAELLDHERLLRGWAAPRRTWEA